MRARIPISETLARALDDLTRLAPVRVFDPQCYPNPPHLRPLVIGDRDSVNSIEKFNRFRCVLLFVVEQLDLEANG